MKVRSLLVTILLAAIARVALADTPCEQKVADGSPHARSADQIKKALEAIYAAPTQKLDAVAAERDLALRQLKVFRYLAEVPYEKLTLNDEYNKLATAAAKVCDKLGRLDHRPPNPGMPDAEYKLAAKGAAASNLAGFSMLPKSVKAYMNDSDPDNIDVVGHRRWCINPAMGKVGFGSFGKTSAMYAHDSSNSAPDYDFICYPAKGLMPIEYFAPFDGHLPAWSVSFNPRKYKVTEQAKASIFPADEQFNKTGGPLKLDFHRVDFKAAGIPNGVIFRPEKFNPKPGQRFLVEIEGVGRPVKYLVEFMLLNPIEEGAVVAQLKGQHVGIVSDIRISTDGKLLVSGSIDGAALWDMSAYKPLRWLTKTKNVLAVDLSADGKLALVGAAGSFAIFEAATGKELASFKADDLGVALSPNGKLVAAARPDRLRLVEIASGKSINLPQAGGNLRAGAFTADSQRVAVVLGTTVLVCDAQTGKELSRWATKESLTAAVAITEDARLLAIRGDDQRSVKLHNVATGAVVRTIGGHELPIDGLGFSRDGKWLVANSTHLDLNIETKLWEVASGKAMNLPSEAGHAKTLRTSDGKDFVSPMGGVIRVWRLKS